MMIQEVDEPFLSRAIDQMYERTMNECSVDHCEVMLTIVSA
jgi:hypothetical protein